MGIEEYTEVLCVTTKLTIGGVQTFFLNYAPLLLKHGVRLNFAVEGKDEYEYDNYFKSLGCRIFHVTPLSESKVKYMRDIRKLLKNNKEIKIIHSHRNFANAYSLIASLGITKRRISHSHNNYAPKSLLNRISKLIWQLVMPIFVTDFWGCGVDANKWLYGIHNKKSIVIRNAIDIERFKYDKNKRKCFRDRLKVNDKKLWINVGSLSPAKNQMFLIEIFNEYVKNHDDIKLLLCGDGILYENIQKYVENKCLTDKVVFLGSQTNPEDYLCAADLYVFPSIFEGFPISTIEAECSGIPAIVSKAIPKELLLNDNCISVDSYDVKDWIEAIESVENISFDRNNGYKNVIKAGLSIETEALKLAVLYKNPN